MTKQYNQRLSKGGRGSGGKGQNYSSSSTKKFHPLSSSMKPKHSFETVRTSFLDHLQVLSTTTKNMNDMVQSIEQRKLVVIEEPQLKFSTKTDKDEKEAENKAFESSIQTKLKI